MRSNYIVMACIVSAFLFLVPAAGTMAAQQPMDVVKAGTQEVLQTLRVQRPDDTRTSELRSLSEKYIDFQEMAKRSLGAEWKNQPEQKQREFVDVFSQFLFNRYITQVEKNQDVDITFKGQETDGERAVVYTTATLPGGTESGLDYRLHMNDGNWKAYDVVIEGVSLVNNYRTQFRSILSSQSFDDLLNMLKDKNRQSIG